MSRHGSQAVGTLHDKVLLLCRDNVATETITTRGRVSHPSCCDRVWSGLRVFMLRHDSFHVTTGFDLDRGFLIATENSLSLQGLALVREFSCRDGEFDVATRLDKTNSFSIATVWRYVACDREGQTSTKGPGARDRHGWARMTEISLS